MVSLFLRQLRKQNIEGNRELGKATYVIELVGRKGVEVTVEEWRSFCRRGGAFGDDEMQIAQSLVGIWGV
jgi:hypothetical protein